MAEFPYWADNWFATREIKRQFGSLKDQVRDASVESAADLRTLLSAIDQVETDVGRALLKIHAIAEVLVEKGLVTSEDLAAKAQELDGLDGETDGVLHPSVFRTEAEQQRTLSPRAYLIAMEKEAVTPKEFLANLEAEDNRRPH